VRVEGGGRQGREGDDGVGEVDGVEEVVLACVGASPGEAAA